jgi:amidophosphoribosyltransferase
VCAIEGAGLLAMRDPNGIRPLILGKGERGYCVASESIVFQQLGYERVRDLERGEALWIRPDMTVESRIVSQAPQHNPCMFEWVYFARPDSIIDDRAVYNARLKLGSELAREFKGEVDVVIPVPDTARTAAAKFAEVLGVKHREGLIKNRYSLRTFIMPDQESREMAVSVKLNPIISVIEGQRVAVVDDSIVRGTTSKHIVTLLRKAGAKEVHFVSTCPPIIHPCFYGIDMPTEDELIASSKSVDEIREYIGADSLTYLSLDGLKRALKKESPCMACLTNDYPIPVSAGEKAAMADSRTCARKC